MLQPALCPFGGGGSAAVALAPPSAPRRAVLARVPTRAPLSATRLGARGRARLVRSQVSLSSLADPRPLRALVCTRAEHSSLSPAPDARSRDTTVPRSSASMTLPCGVALVCVSINSVGLALHLCLPGCLSRSHSPFLSRKLAPHAHVPASAHATHICMLPHRQRIREERSNIERRQGR